MDRKRIIVVETSKGEELVNQLNEIERGVEELKKKTSEKWVMPVILLVLTTLFGVINFLVERHYSNSDIYTNKVREKVAELRATEDVEFFRKSKVYLDSIDVTFESYCRWGADSTDDRRMSVLLTKMRSLVSQNIQIEKDFKKNINTYCNYVAASGVTINNKRLGDEERIEYYNKSKKVFLVTIESLNKALSNLTK